MSEGLNYNQENNYMFKILNIVVLLSLAAFLTLSATDKKKERKSKKMENTNQETAKIVENPHYFITVTQGTENFGDIEIELYPEIAPKTCKNFDSLVAEKFFDGTAFHRVIPGFMVQGGDPNSKNKTKDTWGYGDPNQAKVPAEFNNMRHERGVLSMARANDPNSASSQFFIMHAASPHLDGQYTAFGKVITGIEIVDRICTVRLGGSQNSAPDTKVEMKIRKK